MLNEYITHLIPSGIRRFTNLAKATPGCCMLTIGEPDFDTPQEITQAAQTALAQGLTHYAPNRGTDALREKIAAYETRRGMICKKENILITIGATGALNTALSGILNPGQEVIIPTPAFSLYASIALSVGAKPVALDVSKTDFQITREALEPLITENTRAIVLNSPNNPTGVVLNQGALDVVEELTRDKPITILCDNVYAALSSRTLPDLTLRPDWQERVILCQSFSKPWAMTGWRIGYLVAPEPLVEAFVLLQAAQIAAVPTFVQKAAETALEVSPKPMAETYAKRRKRVCDRLRHMGLAFPEPEGAFYVFADIRKFGLDDETFCIRLIQEAGVACVPGSCFDCPGFIRISYCYSDEDLEKGLDRLERFCNSLK